MPQYTLFTKQLPSNLSTGLSNREIGRVFRSSVSGYIRAVQYQKSSIETGTHIGRIWRVSDQALLASVTYVGETTAPTTAGNWQEQALPTPLFINANTDYVVSVNVNARINRTTGTFPIFENITLSSATVNGSLSVGAAGTYPVENNTFFHFCDVVFEPASVGQISITGTLSQNRILTATVSDLDGIQSTISYQWQSSTDGTNWVNITGETTPTLLLTNSLVGRRVRANATYTDLSGTNESITSTATNIISNVNDTGTILITGTPVQGQTLTIALNDIDGLPGSGISYQWQSSTDNGLTWSNLGSLTSNSSFLLTNSHVGTRLRVIASYTDSLGTAESITSASTLAVLNVNDPGAISISYSVSVDGTPIEGETLTATVSDIDRLTSVTINYQWLVSDDNTNWNFIAGATSSTLVLNSTLSGKRVRAYASYTDNQGTVEGITSVSTNPVRNVNNSGIITVTGIPTQDNTLTASISDADGISGVSISYQWQSSVNSGSTWQNISGATTSTLILTNTLVGRIIRATASYTDTQGTAESIIGTGTSVVANINDLGILSITGTPTQNNTLTATVSDVDGMSGVVINYQWQSSSDNGANWVNITEATSSTLSLSNSLVNKVIRVTARYIDELGTSEALTSGNTSIVINVNDLGTITITGIPAQNNTLTATVSDIDGLTSVTINYQWLSSSDNVNWNYIPGATSPTLFLDASLAGKRVRATASYTDNLGSTESIASSTTIPIANVNDAGAINIVGVTTRYQTLTAVVTDIDGLSGVISYQWQSSTDGIDWTNISGSTSSTLLLNTPLVGKRVRAIASYTDDLGTGESLTSTATSLITSTNTVGSIVIAGSNYKNQVLDAVVTDVDGVSGDISYQWQSSIDGTNWTNCNFGNDQSLYLNYTFVGKRVKVIASYTDNFGTSETLTSSATNLIREQDYTKFYIGITGVMQKGQILGTLFIDRDNRINTDYDIIWQWQSSSDFGVTWDNIGEPIASYGPELLLDSSLVNKRIGFIVTYIDTLGNSQTETFYSTTKVYNNNTVGSIVIAGSPIRNQLLTAVVTDVDGVSRVISYQWQSSTDGTNWTNISGSTSSTLLLNTPLVGKRVRATASYTDDFGASETLTSTPTALITNTNTIGTIIVTGSPIRNQVLTAVVTDVDGITGAVSYQWQSSIDGVIWADITEETNSTLLLTIPLIGKQVRVIGVYTDDFDTTETLTSNTTSFITNINILGTIIIAGSPFRNQVLTAVVNDLDGITEVIEYQWQASNDGVIWTDIGDETNSTLLLTTPLVGKQVRAIASYTDDIGSRQETLISAATNFITSINIAGSVIVAGSPIKDQMLTAIVNDVDSISQPITYQWQSTSDGNNWVDITGATSATLLLTTPLVGKQVRVVVDYTDDLDTNETLISNSTTLIINTVSSIVINGTPTREQLLTAVVTDADGIPGIINYQWMAKEHNGSWYSVTSATSSTLLLDRLLVGKQVRVLAEYKDIFGVAKNIISLATIPVVNTNTIGTLTILGDPVLNTSLTALVEDEDGLLSTNITYEWQFSTDSVDWYTIGDSNTSSLLLTNDLEDKIIRVLAEYTDNSGFFNSIVSEPTTPVIYVPQIGEVLITGLPIELEILTATISDLDGILNADFIYQWQYSINNVDWLDLITETNNSIFLTNQYVGKYIRVLVTYTDDRGYLENIVSSSTSQILTFENVKSLIISGDLVEGSTLSVKIIDNYLVDDTSEINYQWQISPDNGLTWKNLITDNESTLLLKSKYVNKKIRVLVEYTNVRGEIQNLISASTSIIRNLNNFGEVKIIGTVSNGKNLYAEVSDKNGIIERTLTYQWQISIDNCISWSDVIQGTSKSIFLNSSKRSYNLRVVVNYVDTLNKKKTITSLPKYKSKY